MTPCYNKLKHVTCAILAKRNLSVQKNFEINSMRHFHNLYIYISFEKYFTPKINFMFDFKWLKYT